mgnify:CR=1 FL=1
MQGNTYHYEVITIPACTYYAVSIESLPAGQYYLCVYQGSNYAIGVFIIKVKTKFYEESIYTIYAIFVYNQF